MKHLFSRSLILFASTLVSLFIATQSAWGADAVSATHSPEGQTHTWTNISATVTKDNAIGGDGLYFEAGSKGDISTDKGVVNIKEGRIMYVQVPSATSTGRITIYAADAKADRYVQLNSGAKISMAKEEGGGSSANFVAGDIVNINNGDYIKLVSLSDYKFNKIVVVLDAPSPSPSTYTVTYNANGGECGTTSETYSGTQLTLPTPTRDGYTFTGWYDAATGGNLIGKAGASYTPTANITLFAQWTEATTPDPGAGGGEVFYIVSGKCNETLTTGMLGAKYQILKCQGGNTSAIANKEIVSSNTSTSSFYYSSTSVAEVDLLATTNYSTSSTNATMQGLKITSSSAINLTLNKTITKVVIVGRCASNDASVLTIKNGENVLEELNTSSQDVFVKTYTNKSGFTSISMSSNLKEYHVYVYLWETSTPALPACETPNINTQPKGNTYCKGADIAALSVAASVGGSGALSYQWQRDGADISGAIEATYTPKEAGTYTCVVTNTLDDHTPASVTSNEAVITINPAPAITTQPTSVSVTVNNPATLTVVATDATTYQWYTCDSNGDNPKEISGKTGNTLTVTPEALGTTYYKVIASNACGTATSDVVFITATDGPCFEVTRNATIGSIAKGTNTDASSYFNVTAEGKIAFTTTGSGRSVDEKGVEMDNDNDYFLITLPNGSAFAPGTKISFVVYSTNNDRGLTINGTPIKGSRTNDLISGSITLPAEFTVTDSIKIYRAGGKVYFQSLTVEGCGKMCINPQLAWSAETVEGILGEPETFSFPTLDNSTNRSLITYASSDETVATISADGKTITPHKVGTTTISATYAGDEDYCAQTVSYTLHVRCAVAPKITLESGANAQCYETVVLRAVRSDDGNAYTTGTFQWYKNGAEIQGKTDVTFTTTEPGTYTVAYKADGDCEVMSVNSAKVTSTVVKPVVEKKAPHRNYQIANRTLRPYTSATHYPLFDVTPTPTNAYEGQTWHPSYTIHATGTGNITAGTAAIDWVREDAKKGDTITLGANYEALRTWLGTYHKTAAVGDTIMLTMRAVNACDQPDNATADSIPIILTDKYSLAYIVRGKTIQISKDNYTIYRDFYKDVDTENLNDNLYIKLCEQYNVTPVNAYATYSYANYEPYDLLLLTDYPNATGGEKQATYIDSLADLVDKKPILSLKAHMSALPKWIDKGFTSNPIVPGNGTEAQAQKTLTVLCFSHDMFTDADWDDEALRTLTILRDVYKDDGKFKGIQGFTAINSSEFMNIATVYDSLGKRNIVACCERQKVVDARFIMLSINRGATQYINDRGADAIDKLLEYLLQTDASKLSDCSITFDNGAEADGGTRTVNVDGTNYTSGNKQWSNPANWNSGKIPTQLQNVRIEANCIVSGKTYGAGNIRIKDGNTLTIAPNGGLASVGKFGVYTGTNWNTPSNIADTKYITVKANKDSTGMLMHSHTDRLAATVEMYSPARYDGTLANGKPKRVWSYVAIPVEEGTVPDIFNGAYTYLWQETTTGWIRYRDGSTFHDFDAIALSQPNPMIFTFAGDLALAQEYRFTLTNTASGKGGMNLIGNSWTAPIQITKLETSDFGEGLAATVYIYSTGRDVLDGEGNVTINNDGTTTAGCWTAIPIEAAKSSDWKGPKIIPAMQAFEVNFAPGATATEATLTLDYNTIVRASGVDYTTLNQKLYAPGRNSTAEILQPDPSAPAPYEPTMLRIRVADTAACYNLYLLQGERFSEGFDNGWDGFFTGTDGRAPGLCALTTAGEMQVSAQPEIDNTTLVFTQGKSDTYTFTFCLTESEDEPLAEPLYLNDMQLRKSCLIDDSRTYTFQSSESDMENRFVISHIAFEEQDTPTGIANLATVDQQLLLNNPAREMLTIRVYDPAGKLCSEQQTDAPLLQLSLPTTQGVYMLYITGEQTQILRKAIQ